MSNRSNGRHQMVQHEGTTLAIEPPPDRDWFLLLVRQGMLFMARDQRNTFSVRQGSRVIVRGIEDRLGLPRAIINDMESAPDPMLPRD